MSTLAEIEKAIEALPPDQWQKIRRWIESRAPMWNKAVSAGDVLDFDQWLATSTGMAKDNFTTDERMRETRGKG